MAATRKSQDPELKKLKEIGKEICKQKKISYTEWENNVIKEEKLRLISDEDPTWINEVLKRNLYDLLMDEYPIQGTVTKYE